MCGIAGAVWWHPDKQVNADVLQRMTDAIQHRGPDAEGHWRVERSGDRRPGVALGHRRLSIIDIAGSAQPLGNHDGTVQIVFNGEIYNYRELKADLARRGHQFRTSGDTEVIVGLYDEFGMDFVDKLRGMFALAIWDSREQQLVIARDRLGQKPFFYRLDEGRFAFASELKSLLQIPGIPRELDRHSVLRFLTLQYVPAPHSILQGYTRLPPATIAVLKNGQLNARRYWTPPYDQPELGRNRLEDWSDELRAEMTEAVKLRLRSDVPLGAFLSGGLDSTITTGLMQEQLDQPVKTFSIGFPIKKYDERHYARQAAEMLGTDHHEAVVTPNALEILPQLIWHYDEPFGDSSAIPSMYLSRMTREHVTVALTGDAGDELFCGYRRYQAMRRMQKLQIAPRWAWRMAASLAKGLPSSQRQRSPLRRAKQFFSMMAMVSEKRYANWVSIIKLNHLQRLVSSEMRHLLADIDPTSGILDAYQMFPGRDFVTRTMAADLETYLPCDLNTKVDIASMHVGLECRSPMLDHKVVELAARMPLEVKQSSRDGKRILTHTFRDLIPADIQTRPKHGFSVPINHWFRNELKPLVQDALLSETSRSRGLFDEREVRLLLDQHLDGHYDHAPRLWNLLCLELWQRMYLDQVPPISTPTAI